MRSEVPVDFRTARMQGDGVADEYRIEILASDQAGVMQPFLGRIGRLVELRRSENLQRVDDEVEKTIGRDEGRRGTQETGDVSP